MNNNKMRNLTNVQIAAYGTVAFNRLKNSGNIEIKEDLIYSYILTLLKLHDEKEIEQICSNLISENE